MSAEWTMILERFHTTGFTNFLLMMVVYGLYGIGNQLKLLNQTAWRGVYKDDLGN